MTIRICYVQTCYKSGAKKSFLVKANIFVNLLSNITGHIFTFISLSIIFLFITLYSPSDGPSNPYPPLSSMLTEIYSVCGVITLTPIVIWSINGIAFGIEVTLDVIWILIMYIKAHLICLAHGKLISGRCKCHYLKKYKRNIYVWYVSLLCVPMMCVQLYRIICSMTLECKNFAPQIKFDVYFLS